MKKNIEILAPAGSYEGMKAAMNAGCDAVYIGGNSFGARAYANNLEEDILLRTIDEAHIRDKKLYLTVNTLLKEKELTSRLYSFLERYYLQGLDAVIVQDVGVMHFIHKHFPELSIHASTQMTLTMAQGANLLKDYGVTRLVTSRELTLQEIKNIRENTELEIETFVHGALCYCYSGQCLMSSIIGGRSGNRGRCAQPCRMPYQLYSENKKISGDQEKYLLSPKDINTIAIIPELIEAGIDSFKIEGRMKRPEYAAAVSHMYRKYVDLYLEQGMEDYHKFLKSQEYKKDMIVLQDVYNRGGFSEGYGKSYHGKNMMSLYRPNHSGVLVGEVKEIQGSQVSIVVNEIINAQDILEIRHKEEEGYEFTVKDPHNPGDILKTNVGRRPESAKDSRTQNSNSVNFQEPFIRVGDVVYRTKNNELLNYLNKEYIEKDKRLGIKGFLKAYVGEPISFTVTYGDCKVTVNQELVQEAQKQPMTKEKLLAPLEKTGDTLYYFEEIQVDMGENIFVPVAWLNEIRREAIHRLQVTVAEQYRRTIDTSMERVASEIITGNKDLIDEDFDNKDFGKKAFDKKDLDEKDLKGEVLEEKVPDDKNHKSIDLDDIQIDSKQYDLAQKSSDCILLEQKSFQQLSYKTNAFPGISASIQSQEQYNEVLQLPEIGTIYAEYDKFTVDEICSMAREAMNIGKRFYLSLPHICRLSVYDRLKLDIYEIINSEQINGFLVKNFEEIALLQSLGLIDGSTKDIVLNYNMYTYNREAMAFWAENGINHYTASVELNYQELKSLVIADSDIVVYGYLPVMISAQCLFDNTQGCRTCKAGNNTKKDAIGFSGYMTDRLGKSFFVSANCSGCYNIIYNGQALALHKQVQEIKNLKPRNIRLDFTKESAEQTKQVVVEFINSYYYGISNANEINDYTTGHFKRGVE